MILGRDAAIKVLPSEVAGDVERLARSAPKRASAFLLSTNRVFCGSQAVLQ